MKPLRGVRVAILVEDGSEQVELTRPRRRSTWPAPTPASSRPRRDRVRAWNHIDWGEEFPVDVATHPRPARGFDALLLPGGVMNPDALRMQRKAVEFVKAFFDAGKPVAAICHAPWTVIEAGAPGAGGSRRGRRSRRTSATPAREWMDEEVVVDGNLVSSRKPDDIPAFNREMVVLIHRVAQSGAVGRVRRRR